jgi:hypothetical protein
LVGHADRRKLEDGTFQMSFPCAPDKAVPHLCVNADPGNFVYAVSQLPPGKSYMAEGTTCSWSEYIRLWTSITGETARYRQVTMEQFIDLAPDKEFARELGDMWMYSSDPGYDGGNEALVKGVDIRKVCCSSISADSMLIMKFTEIGMSYDELRGLDEE